MEELVEPQIPAWPAQCGVHTIDTGTRQVELRVQRPEPLEFGADVAGWQISLRNQTNMTIESVRVFGTDDVVLEFLGQWPGGVLVDSPGATIVLLPTQGNETHVKLTCDVREVQTHVGISRVDGESYVLRPRPPQSRGTPAAPIVDGDATIRKITGSGPVEVRASFVAGTAAQQRRLDHGYDGGLSVATPLRGVKLSGDIDVNGTEVEDSCLEVKSLKAVTIASSDVTASERITATTATDSKLTATVQDDVGVAIGRRNGGEKPITEIVDGTGNVRHPSRLVDTSSGVVERCTITAETADVYVGELADSHVDVRSLIAHSIRTTGEESQGTSIHARSHIQVQEAIQLRLGDEMRADGDLVVGSDLIVDGGGASDTEDPAEGGTTVGKSVLVTGRVIGGTLVAPDATVHQAVEAARLEVDGAELGASVAASTIISRKSMTIAGEVAATTLHVNDLSLGDATVVDADTTLTITGSAALPQGFAGSIHWAPRAKDKELTVAGVPAAVQVTQTGEPAILTVSGESEGWPHLAVDGTAHVAVASPGKNSTVVWSLARLLLASAESVLTIRPDRATVVQTVEAAKGAAIVRMGGSETFRVCADGARGLRLEAAQGTISSVLDKDVDVELRTSGKDRIEVVGVLRRLDGPPGSAPTFPVVDVPAGSVIQELRGSIRLGQIDGRIEVPGEGQEDAPIIRGIEEQATDERKSKASGGYVVGVNPAGVPYEELDHAQAFHVFEPDPKALMKWAKEDREPHEFRTAAASAQRIHEQVKASAASGGARSGAAWAAARTHHVAADRSNIEKAARWVHRCLGYSQRPGPAALTYALMVTAWTIAACLLDLVAVEHQPEHPFWRSRGDTAELLGRIALLPVTWFLRVAETDGATTLFTNLAVGVVAFITISVPFVFFVVAVRNFMASPDGRSL